MVHQKQSQNPSTGCRAGKSASARAAPSPVVRVAGKSSNSSGDAEPISLADDLHNCRHFFRSTFDNGTTPAVNLGFGGAVQVSAPAANNVVFGIQFDPPMRSATMVTTVYNPGAANNFMRNVDTADLSTITATDLGQTGMVFTATLANSDENDRIAMHYVASVDI